MRGVAEKLREAAKYPVDPHPERGAIYPAVGAAVAHLLMYASLLEGVCVVCSIAERNPPRPHLVREPNATEIGIEPWMESKR